MSEHGSEARAFACSNLAAQRVALVRRIAEQAIRDGLIDKNLCQVAGWQKQYNRTEVELANPRSPALPAFAALEELANALVTASTDDRHLDRRTHPG